MTVIGGLASLTGAIMCFALLFVIVMVALVVWYWKNQPKMEVSVTAPEPPIAASIQHPTAAQDHSATAPAVTPVTAPSATPAPAASPAPEAPESAPAAPSAPEAPAAPPSADA